MTSGITLNGAAVVAFHDCELASTFSPAIAGTGTVTMDAVRYTGSTVLATTITQTIQSAKVQLGELTPVAGAVTLTQWQDLIRVDHSGGAIACNLPDSNTVPKGARGVIKSINVGAANITVTPFAGQFIDEALATVVIASAKGFLELQCRGASLGWQVVGKFL